MTFSMRAFIKNGFLNAVGKMADYQIVLNAAGYLDKGVLTAEDLAEIQSAIDAKNAPPPAAPSVAVPLDTAPGANPDNHETDSPSPAVTPDTGADVAPQE